MVQKIECLESELQVRPPIGEMKLPQEREVPVRAHVEVAIRTAAVSNIGSVLTCRDGQRKSRGEGDDRGDLPSANDLSQGSSVAEITAIRPKRQVVDD